MLKLTNECYLKVLIYLFYANATNFKRINREDAELGGGRAQLPVLPRFFMYIPMYGWMEICMYVCITLRKSLRGGFPTDN